MFHYIFLRTQILNCSLQIVLRLLFRFIFRNYLLERDLGQLFVTLRLNQTFEVGFAVPKLLCKRELLLVLVGLEAFELPLELLDLSLHVLYLVPGLISLLLVLEEEHVCIYHLIELKEVVALHHSFLFLIVLDPVQTEKENLWLLKDPALLEALWVSMILYIWLEEVLHLTLEGLVPGLVESVVGFDVQVDRSKLFLPFGDILELLSVDSFYWRYWRLRRAQVHDLIHDDLLDFEHLNLGTEEKLSHSIVALRICHPWLLSLGSR